ncbi:glutamate synthase subunit beta [Mobilitalea sibirica]|uniref:Glutamate synthase subunit beta n=1 Tax=Mobilitalea sibirica TaxID=1462919 RepID=A0A8J7HC08_9FIRM|nr:glutamate synthase subunit beta [Mobilitalea sibirica]MBH1940537.1 glutamate synthase subunit beta [Mobilitalea sibirica]
MGKPTGFMEYERSVSHAEKPKERIKHFNEFHQPLSMEERKCQGARCMECGVPFCQSGIIIGGMASGCPINNLIPEWNDSIYRGNMKQALSRLMKTNNFPEFTGRVCPAPCEAACTCSLNGDAVAIKENELTIIEHAYEEGYFKPNPPKVRTGKKIAIIGSGPAGLSAADQLNKRGHSVTVYERSDRLGGLLMYGIPNMKLEKQIIKRRINIMKEEGITFVTKADIGGNYNAEEIMKSYDSVILACGASNPRDIKVPGREAKGIHFAVDYLKATTKDILDRNKTLTPDFKNFTITAKGKKVLVIGGGDTGNDCVGTAIRQGAISVVQLEMMPKLPDQRADNNPWPEWPKVAKTDYGQEEAISLYGEDPRVYQTTVREFIADEQGNVCKAKIVRLESKFNEESKRFMMEEIAGSEYEIEVDMVLIAAGFLGAQSYVADAFGVELDVRTNVKTDAGNYQTNVDNVFVAGDMHRGQSLVVWAIREGREAAKAVDTHIMGYSNL